MSSIIENHTDRYVDAIQDFKSVSLNGVSRWSVNVKKGFCDRISYNWIVIKSKIRPLVDAQIWTIKGS